MRVFSATTLPSTATWKMPPLPGNSSASNSKRFFNSAAARAALGLYPQLVQ